ncbi:MULTISPECIES: hypothetical protein [unclassified Bartonella]
MALMNHLNARKGREQYSRAGKVCDGADLLLHKRIGYIYREIL